ncbi:MAG: glycosyltransferase family 4 protein [Planctomycetota bacterium]|nr:glycosyltransferase family 4 protein [Planctomycetota bacterium]
MRILIFCEFARLHGAEHSLLSVLESVSAAGFELHVAAPPAGALAVEIRRRDIVLLPLEFPAAATHQRQTERRKVIRSVLRQSQPDLVHTNSLAMSRITGPLVAEMDLRSLGHLRDILRLSRQAISDLNCHTRLLAVSAATRNWHVDQGVDAHRTFVLHNGVDLEAFAPRPLPGHLHAELQLAPDVPLVGTVGQIGMRKGTDLFLQAACQIASSNPSAQFVVFGERTSEKAEARQLECQLQARAQQSPLAGRCHFMGYRSCMSQWLNELTILVHPARQEPLGRVLLEAAASGLSIVATAVGGTNEIFPSATHSAIVVPPDNVEQLAGAVKLLLKDKERRRALGRAARARAETAFDRQQSAAGLISHYHQLLDS